MTGYIRQNWKPSNELLCVPKVQNLPYKSPNWWNSSKVIIPWMLHDRRYVPAVLNFSARVVYVMDPLYEDMDADQKRGIQIEFLPLLLFLPYWLHGTGYWDVNRIKINGPKVPDFEWKIDFFRKADLFSSPHPHCSGAVSCMNIERYFSQCPNLQGDIDCCKYRNIMICRIWSHANI